MLSTSLPITLIVIPVTSTLDNTFDGIFIIDTTISIVRVEITSETKDELVSGQTHLNERFIEHGIEFTMIPNDEDSTIVDRARRTTVDTSFENETELHEGESINTSQSIGYGSEISPVETIKDKFARISPIGLVRRVEDGMKEDGGGIDHDNFTEDGISISCGSDSGSV